MNQEKIGIFISQCRKNKYLTQEKLGELLGVSNRTISKWENGKCMPDYSVVPFLCEKLDITINELFSGEKLEEKQYQNKLEENFILNINELRKNLWKKIKMISLVLITLIILFFIALLAFLNIYQTKIYLSKDELYVNICKNHSNMVLTIKSLDGEGIMIEATKNGSENFFKAYRYKYLKNHQKYSNIARFLFSDEIPSMYINNKLIYEEGMIINECNQY